MTYEILFYHKKLQRVSIRMILTTMNELLLVLSMYKTNIAL